MVYNISYLCLHNYGKKLVIKMPSRLRKYFIPQKVFSSWIQNFQDINSKVNKRF